MRPLRVVYLAAGSGTRWCGACVHSIEVVRALRTIGVDAILVPAYLPLSVDESGWPATPIFFGGVSVLLEHYVPLFRHMPAWLDRLWDNRWVLGWLGRLSPVTDPSGLGPLTLSMLAGEEGRQAKELQKLLRFLEQKIRPDIVHLSTGLLVGVARTVHGRLGVPVVATLAGEDNFLEALPEPYRTQGRLLAAERLRELPALVALSSFYRQRVVDYFGLAAKQVWVIPPGVTVNAENCDPNGITHATAGRCELRIGFLGRICREKGFALLADALLLMARGGGDPSLQVFVAGRVEPTFRPQFLRLQRQLRRAGWDFRYLGPLSSTAKEEFFGSVDVLVLPSSLPEAKAVTAIEAVIRGLPVIAPAQGATLEIVGRTGIGELYWPNTAQRLAEVLRRWCGQAASRHVPRADALQPAQQLLACSGSLGQSEEDASTAQTCLRASVVKPRSAQATTPQAIACARKDRPPESQSPMPVPLAAAYYRAERMARQTLALYQRLLAPDAYGLR